MTAKRTGAVTRWIFTVRSNVNGEVFTVMGVGRPDTVGARKSRIEMGLMVGPIVRIEIPLPAPKARK